MHSAVQNAFSEVPAKCTVRIALAVRYAIGTLLRARAHCRVVQISFQKNASWLCLMLIVVNQERLKTDLQK